MMKITKSMMGRGCVSLGKKAHSARRLLATGTSALLLLSLLISFAAVPVMAQSSVTDVTFAEQGISGSPLPMVYIGNASYPFPYTTAVNVGSSITFGLARHWGIQTNGANVEYSLTHITVSQGYTTKNVTTYPPQPSYTLTVTEFTTVAAVYAAPTTTPTGTVSVAFAESGLPSGGLVTLNGTAYPLPYSSSFPANSTVAFAFASQFTGNSATYVLSGLTLQVPGYSAVGYPAQASYSIPLYYNDTTITAQYNLAPSTPPSTQPSTQPSTMPVTTTPSQGTSPTPSLAAAALVGAAVVVAVVLAARKRRVKA